MRKLVWRLVRVVPMTPNLLRFHRCKLDEKIMVRNMECTRRGMQRMLFYFRPRPGRRALPLLVLPD
jgi:hypothetical protein